MRDEKQWATTSEDDNTPDKPGPPELPVSAEAMPSDPLGHTIESVRAYRLDSTRASFGELRRDMGIPLFMVGWMTKVLGVPLPGAVNDANVESIGTLECDRQDVPSECENDLTSLEAALRQLGFRPETAVTHVSRDINSNSRVASVSMASSDGKVLARATARAFGLGYNSKRKFVEYLTEMSSGQWILTTNAAAAMDVPATIHRSRVVRAGAQELRELHQQSVDRQTSPPTRFSSQSDVRSAIERQHLLLRDFHLARGVFKPMPEHEIRLAAASQSGDPSAGVLSEISRLQRKRSGSLISNLILLAISLFIFVAVFRLGEDTSGFGLGSWESLGILVGVLLFHEMGHWLAMKVFGYRNLKMFFIPMFGAAVTGVNRTAEGWKKVLVSLAGPVPGIVVGSGLLVYAMQNDHILARKAAVMMIVINLFNLLPILPLDGGHVARALIFSRHWMLDVAFRVIAVLALGFLAAASGGGVIIGLIVLMVMSIPAVVKTGKVAAQLRQEGVTAVETPDGELPQATMTTIVARLRPAAMKPGSLTDTRLAGQAIQVFELVAEKPPGWLATLGLLCAYAVSCLIPLVVLAALVLSNFSGGLGRFARMAMAGPKDLITVASVSSVGKPIARVDDRAWIGVNVATEPAAVAAQAEWATKLKDDERILRVGRVLFVSLSDRIDGAKERRQEWRQIIETVSTDFTISTPDRLGEPVAMSVVVSTLDRAEAAEIVVGIAGLAPHPIQLMLPWSAEWASADEASKANWTRARRTMWEFDRLMGWESDRLTGLSKSPQFVDAQKALRVAQRRGDEEEIVRASEKVNALRDAARTERFTEMRTSAKGTLDVDLLDRMQAAWVSDQSRLRAQGGE